MLYLGDCLEIMKTLPNQSVDLILCDPPYGSTAAKWDEIIPFDSMWYEYWRVLKPNGAVLIFGAEPFSTKLRSSQFKAYRYDWTWIKNLATNFFHAKRMPLRKTENISVFYRKQPKYTPIRSIGHEPTQSAFGFSKGVVYHGKNKREYQGGDTTRLPTNVLDFKVVDPKLRVHANQKPVELLEYLIRTYTAEGDTVLDNTMGSGSTGVAAKNTNRKFIGIELDENYFEIAKQRINVVP